MSIANIKPVMQCRRSNAALLRLLLAFLVPQATITLLNHLAPYNLDYKAQIHPMTTVCNVCSLRPSWPSLEAAELPHMAMVCLLQQELNIAAARCKHLSYHIDTMYTRMFRINQQLSQVC